MMQTTIDAPAPVAPLPTRRSYGRYQPVQEPTGDDWPAVACFNAAEARRYCGLGWPELVLARNGFITLEPGVRVFTRPV